jgi:hypothetical protein
VLLNINTSSPSCPSQTSKTSGFHRSNEGPELGYPAYLQKYEEIPRIGTAPQDLDPNRPSPDQDMGCSPRGKHNTDINLRTVVIKIELFDFSFQMVVNSRDLCIIEKNLYL